MTTYSPTEVAAEEEPSEVFAKEASAPQPEKPEQSIPRETPVSREWSPERIARAEEWIKKVLAVELRNSIKLVTQREDHEFEMRDVASERDDLLQRIADLEARLNGGK